MVSKRALRSHRKSPIGALPMEVLANTFLILVSDEFEAAPFDEYVHSHNEPTSYPWTLLEVCRRWKDVCLGNPLLWTYFRLDGHECTLEGQYNIKPLLRTRLQLKRSQDALIMFDATGLCTCRCEATRFRTIATHAQRWKVVAFSFDLGGAPDFITTSTPDVVRSLIPENVELKSLEEIHWRGDFIEYRGLSLPLDCSSLPTGLRLASLTGLVNYRTQASFPWDQLDTLILNRFFGSVLDLMDLLRECQNLTHLDIGPVSALNGRDALYDSRPPASGTALLPRLDTLCLAKHASRDLSRLLPLFKMPNLRFLDLHCNDVHPDSIPFITDCITSCQTTLTNLTLYYPRLFDPDEFLSLALSWNHLKHLCLRDLPGTKGSCDPFLEMASRREAGTGKLEILPRLECLEIRDLEFDPLLLAQVVEARTQPHTLSADGDQELASLNTGSLRSLTIAWHCSVDTEDVPSASYHIQAADEFLAEYVRDRRLKLECFFYMY